MKTLSTIIITLLAIFSFACTDDDATTGSISGTVIAAEDITNEDIAQMTIYIEYDSEVVVLKDSVDLDETGVYSFSNLEFGSYRLFINEDDEAVSVAISEEKSNATQDITVSSSSNFL